MLDILHIYDNDSRIEQILDLSDKPGCRIHLSGLSGSASALVIAPVIRAKSRCHLIVMPDKESAAFFYNDLERMFGEMNLPYPEKQILFFPSSYKRPYEPDQVNNANVLSRTEVIIRLGSSNHITVVSYPEALCEKVVEQVYLDKNKLSLHVGETCSMDFLTDVFNAYEFERTDFVIEPGQFSIRGGLVDVFSYADEFPYRIVFDVDVVESIRRFDPASQLSKAFLDQISILPDIHSVNDGEKRLSILELFPSGSLFWFNDLNYTAERIENEFIKVSEAYEKLESTIKRSRPEELFLTREEFLKTSLRCALLEFGRLGNVKNERQISFNTSPQPPINKNFELLKTKLEDRYLDGFQNFILCDNAKQEERIHKIFDDILTSEEKENPRFYSTLQFTFHEGFIDNDLRIVCLTDHQIFERYHRYHLREGHSAREALTIKDLYGLKPGDYVSHIDHGIGRFDGLEKIENDGKIQEALRIIYKNDDILYVNIHSLHRIARYTGKEGTVPGLNRLGSGAWSKIKENTKKRVKDIARDLIRLYANRRNSKGFSFTPDTYLQHELEASFIFEDTPDQLKSTIDIKQDMEAPWPMDRLICGDVGFGKTEVAIRAAFKAVTDSKQVAVLVPTTILAIQHFKTFSDRLRQFPCKVDYINRFRSTNAQKQSIKDLEAGKTDIIIGTHRMLSKDIKFKDLGLLVIDEEQKFGVAAKEKLKLLKVNVDTLTLTATPIPRTLQFSMMGARDLSLINTPPPNRYPIQTELHSFNEDIIRDAIYYEISRGGQVFFIHNRIQNIMEIAGMIQKYLPDAKIATAHGQMEGSKLEEIMIGFIEGEYDILVSTTIVESGLDIPNVNTIFINEAHHYGLSDLHQLRGRVGRSNKKAFCYLLAPPMTVLTEDARKRLKAIEEFSELGSGFNIAMRDLDIRGAGNILGGEQSGFISDIGFEMYQKILDEAIIELKQHEFKNDFSEFAGQNYVKDCVIETDLEILIPDEYVSNSSERIYLYKELDNCETEEVLQKFGDQLIDRFGPLPAQTVALFDTLRLRWVAKELGFEKLILKKQMLTGYFISNPESSYFETDKFTRILEFVKSHQKSCKMREHGDKLLLSFTNVNSALRALELLRCVSAAE